VVPADVDVITYDRVRPRLIGGRPVLLLERTEDGWCCFDRKQCHGDGEGQEEQ